MTRHRNRPLDEQAQWRPDDLDEIMRALTIANDTIRLLEKKLIAAERHERRRERSRAGRFA